MGEHGHPNLPHAIGSVQSVGDSAAIRRVFGVLAIDRAQRRRQIV